MELIWLHLKIWFREIEYEIGKSTGMNPAYLVKLRSYIAYQRGLADKMELENEVMSDGQVLSIILGMTAVYVAGVLFFWWP